MRSRAQAEKATRILPEKLARLPDHVRRQDSGESAHRPRHGDDNVHYQNTEKLVDPLIAANKRFIMMAYPNRSHGISEGAGTSLHLYDLMTNFVAKKPALRPAAELIPSVPNARRDPRSP